MISNTRLFSRMKERKVDEEIPCLRQLLHWNNSPGEGRGKTHAAIVHRLRQLNRNDLADWLGKTAFKQLGKDLDNAIALSFKELSEETETSTSAFHTLLIIFRVMQKLYSRHIFYIKNAK